MNKINKLIKTNFTPNSSFIKEIEYSYLPYKSKPEFGFINYNPDRIQERMLIKFNDGRVIEYQCEESDYLNLISAKSVGKHWHKNIKGVLQAKIIR